MAIGSSQVVTGFEHGAIVLVGGSSVAWWEQLIGDASIQGTIKRTGSYALKMKPTAGQAARVELRHQTLVRVVVRQYIYFVTLPSVNTMLTSEANTSFHTGIAFNAATGKLRAQSGSGPTFGADGPSVTTGVWYRIDFKVTLDTSTAPDTHTLDWEFAVEGGVGVAQPSVTVLANTAGYVSINWGASATLVEAEYYSDDVCVLDGGDFPLGDGKVVLLNVSGEGTHVNATSFTDSGANSPPVSPHSLLNAVPISAAETSYVKQTTIGAGDYIELTLDDLPSEAMTQIIQGVWCAAADRTEGAGPSTTDVRFVNELGTATTIVANGSAALRAAGDGIGHSAIWTPAGVNASLIRIGFSDDVTTNVRAHFVFVEVGYALVPVAAVGSPELDLDPRKIEFTELPYQLHQAMLRMGRGSDEAR